MAKLLAVFGVVALVWLLLVLGGSFLWPGPDRGAAPVAPDGAESPFAGAEAGGAAGGVVPAVPAGEESVRSRGSVSGTVVDGDGNPVPDVSVIVLERGTNVAFAETDSEGAFEIPVPPHAPVTIRAMTRDAMVDRPDVRAADGPLDLALKQP